MIKEFQKEYRWLSNFMPCRVVYAGNVYSTVEHAYQSAKSKDSDWIAFCIRSTSPGEVKRASRTINVRSDWAEIKEKVMYYLLQQKYKQEPYRSKLLSTGNEFIQEGNLWHDTFWGVDLRTGIGKNVLGKMIMKIRSSL